MYDDTITIEQAENWQDHANCLGVDPDLFFPERGASTREAKEVCRGGAAVLATVSSSCFRTARSSASGAGCPNVNGAGSVASALRLREASSEPDRFC